MEFTAWELAALETALERELSERRIEGLSGAALLRKLRAGKPAVTIEVRYRAVDGYRKTCRFKTLRGARKWAHDRVGEHPEIGTGYAASGDGVGTVSVSGCSLAELFPARGAAAPADPYAGLTDEQIEARQEEAAENAAEDAEGRGRYRLDEGPF